LRLWKVEENVWRNLTRGLTFRKMNKMLGSRNWPCDPVTKVATGFGQQRQGRWLLPGWKVGLANYFLVGVAYKSTASSVLSNSALADLQV
jgi:hypothetical protein